ncbi:hypothetical protein NHP21005_10250 [Helicobacter sp. NHP21005]|uniref:putative barnase/colicin E5 family endoribonuclease n=1 Tax=Helicobacter felistomachi TaxID=3040201 RepID=UPI00257338C1|nr:hypothetical protein [Helicobacter sp. NHP21005]BEG57337.1 hypothetical protein NHP21005_10250 [Helicobacter sp. NHP21005]
MTDKITITPEFGENFAEYALKGKEAVKKLLQMQCGQVAQAFYRPDLGESGEWYIDLVWGANAASLKGLKDAKGKPLNPYGLAKILEKHLNDFKDFEGTTPQEKLASGIEEIIQKGTLINEDGKDTLWLKKGDDYYLVGLSKGWFGKGENNWVLTSYKKTKGKIPKELKGDGANLSAYSTKFNPALTSADEPLSVLEDSTKGLKK